MLLSCRFFPVYVAMLQYYRVCHAATRYRSVAVNSRPSATLAEIRVFISAFCLLQLGFLYLAFILPEVFFRQAAFIGIEAVVPHDAEIAQWNVLQQPGEELPAARSCALTGYTCFDADDLKSERVLLSWAGRILRLLL